MNTLLKYNESLNAKIIKQLYRLLNWYYPICHVTSATIITNYCMNLTSQDLITLKNMFRQKTNLSHFENVFLSIVRSVLDGKKDSTKS